jgi:predicted site-specific integrase-resolvase
MNSKSKNGVTIGEAASRLGVAPATMRRWCKAGFGFRLGGHWRVFAHRVAELERNLSAGAGDTATQQ